MWNRWVLWYLKNDRTKAWEDCLKEVATFDTVEDFWALYNHIQLASGLGWGSDYYLFKEGIKPMWEDPANVEGGRWLVQVPILYPSSSPPLPSPFPSPSGRRRGLQVERQRRNEVLDQYWLELIMAMIGEQFEDLGEEICGAVVNIRNKGDKVSLPSPSLPFPSISHFLPSFPGEPLDAELGARPGPEQEDRVSRLGGTESVAGVVDLLWL